MLNLNIGVMHWQSWIPLWYRNAISRSNLCYKLMEGGCDISHFYISIAQRIYPSAHPCKMFCAQFVSHRFFSIAKNARMVLIRISINMYAYCFEFVCVVIHNCFLPIICVSSRCHGHGAVVLQVVFGGLRSLPRPFFWTLVLACFGPLSILLSVVHLTIFLEHLQCCLYTIYFQ